MRFLCTFLARAAANAATIALLAYVLDGFTIIPRTFGIFKAANVAPTAETMVVGGLLLAVLYTFLRPLLRLVSLPLIFLTFGAFNVVISVALLAIADRLSTAIAVEGFAPLVIGGLAIGIANTLFELK